MNCETCGKKPASPLVLCPNEHGGKSTQWFCQVHWREALTDDRYEIPSWSKMKWEREWPPSISAYLQGKQPRPVVHFIWHMPDGIELQSALKNIRRGLCFCGEPRGRNAYGCTPKHVNDFAKCQEYWSQIKHNMWFTDGKYCPDRACAKCGSQKDLEVDHIIPIIDGGAPWDRNNLRFLCNRCHGQKSGADATRRAGIQRAVRIHVQTVERRKTHPPLSAF